MNSDLLDRTTFDCTNTYKEICALSQNIHDGLVYWTRIDFLRRVYTLHRDFHKRALVILSLQSMDKDFLDNYWAGVRKGRRDLAKIYALNKSNTLCAQVKRKIYAETWWEQIISYLISIRNDWGIDLDTNRVIYFPIEDEEELSISK